MDITTMSLEQLCALREKIGNQINFLEKERKEKLAFNLLNALRECKRAGIDIEIKTEFHQIDVLNVISFTMPWEDAPFIV